jgi:hypothetical protein
VTGLQKRQTRDLLHAAPSPWRGLDEAGANDPPRELCGRASWRCGPEEKRSRGDRNETVQGVSVPSPERGLEVGGACWLLIVCTHAVAALKPAAE